MKICPEALTAGRQDWPTTPVISKLCCWHDKNNLKSTQKKQKKNALYHRKVIYWCLANPSGSHSTQAQLVTTTAVALEGATLQIRRQDPIRCVGPLGFLRSQTIWTRVHVTRSNILSCHAAWSFVVFSVVHTRSECQTWVKLNKSPYHIAQFQCNLCLITSNSEHIAEAVKVGLGDTEKRYFSVLSNINVCYYI